MRLRHVSGSESRGMIYDPMRYHTSFNMTSGTGSRICIIWPNFAWSFAIVPYDELSIETKLIVWSCVEKTSDRPGRLTQGL
ncbi:hypothetical protein J6590_089465 [Homalodisca vitripennis]|nr:hypothetical protein J6590_089465 [Homalodisca vitripennis]